MFQPSCEDTLMADSSTDFPETHAQRLARCLSPKLPPSKRSSELEDGEIVSCPSDEEQYSSSSRHKRHRSRKHKRHHRFSSKRSFEEDPQEDDDLTPELVFSEIDSYEDPELKKELEYAENEEYESNLRTHGGKLIKIMKEPAPPPPRREEAKLFRHHKDNLIYLTQENRLPPNSTDQCNMDSKSDDLSIPLTFAKKVYNGNREMKASPPEQDNTSQDSAHSNAPSSTSYSQIELDSKKFKLLKDIISDLKKKTNEGEPLSSQTSSKQSTPDTSQHSSNGPPARSSASKENSPTSAVIDKNRLSPVSEASTRQVVVNYNHLSPAAVFSPSLAAASSKLFSPAASSSNPSSSSLRPSLSHTLDLANLEEIIYKKRELTKDFTRDCDTVRTVANMLVNKDRGIQERVEKAVLLVLKDLRNAYLEELKSFKKSLLSPNS